MGGVVLRICIVEDNSDDRGGGVCVCAVYTSEDVEAEHKYSLYSRPG